MSEEKTELKNRVGLFLLFLACGLLAIGPVQWGNIQLPMVLNTVYKIGIPLIFLVISLLLYRNERFHKFWKLFFAFFIGSMSFLVVWIISFFYSIQNTTVEGFAFNKLIEMILIVFPILLMVKLSGDDMDSILLKRGNIRLGLIIGVGGFIIFLLISFMGAILLFYGTELTWQKFIIWLPWILIFVLSNGLLEEILYRGLYFKKYRETLGFNLCNILQALIYSLMHFGAGYTSESLIFLVITFVLGILYGYIILKTDSLIGTILFHAGTDIAIVLGIFSTL
ncbi:MAG: lysostaphin resistance A-like protein [Promethearchaeota archaeon]